MPTSPVSAASIIQTPGPKPNTPAKIAEAAKQFESLLINQMLQSAHATGDSDNEDQDSALTDLSQQQFAQALAANGGLGIAKMVVAGLKQDVHR